MVTPTYAEYAQLRALADRRTGPFADPRDVNHRIPELMHRRGPDWAHAVLGRACRGVRGLQRWEIELLKAADEQDVAPPLPAAELQARQARRERDAQEQAAHEAYWAAIAAEWSALRAALPVPVTVVHNYKSVRHSETYVQGADHVLVGEPMQVGRFARLAHQALCETAATARSLYFPDAGGRQDGVRYPDCKRCIRRAGALTGVASPLLLAGPRAGFRIGPRPRLA